MFTVERELIKGENVVVMIVEGGRNSGGEYTEDARW